MRFCEKRKASGLMQAIERRHLRVVVGMTVAMSLVVVGGMALGVPLWLLAAGVLFSVLSLVVVRVAQRPDRPSAHLDQRRLVGLFVILPVLVGLTVSVTSLLGFPAWVAVVVAMTTFLGGNYVFFRWLDRTTPN